MGNQSTKISHKYVVTADTEPQNVINSDKAKKWASDIVAKDIERNSQSKSDKFNATLINDRRKRDISVFANYKKVSLIEKSHSGKLAEYKSDEPYTNSKFHTGQTIEELELEFKDGKKSQIKNKYWQGDKYLVIKDDNLIKVLNCNTYKKSEINIDDLTEGLSWTQKKLVKRIIKKLPGEVIEDISFELKHIKHHDDCWAGIYDWWEESAELKTSSSLFNVTLVHELGHAVDCNAKGRELCAWEDSEFNKMFKSERQAFLDAGHERCEMTYNPESHSYEYKEKHRYYCTTNEAEMFAECYCLLMTGYCNSKECILEYFPQTLNAAKQNLRYIRSQPKSKRCNMS